MSVFFSLIVMRFATGVNIVPYFKSTKQGEKKEKEKRNEGKKRRGKIKRKKGI